MAVLFGLMMADVSPDCNAMAKKYEFISSRAGRPKEILDTPRIVLPPSSSWIRRTVSSVTSADAGSAETVMQSPSIMIFSLAIP